MKNRISILAVSALLTLVTLAAQTPAQTPAPPPAAQTPANPDPWISVRFLMGTWESKTTGGVAQAQASAGYAFRLELRDHILARHTRSGVCNAPDDFDCQHSDLLYIYPGESAVPRCRPSTSTTKATSSTTTCRHTRAQRSGFRLRSGAARAAVPA